MLSFKWNDKCKEQKFQNVQKHVTLSKGESHESDYIIALFQNTNYWLREHKKQVVSVCISQWWESVPHSANTNWI